MEENDDEWVRMTAPEVDITDFKLYMTGTAPIEDSDFNQPKVTIYLAGEVRSAERTGTTRFDYSNSRKPNLSQIFNMKYFSYRKKGFTIIETLVAVSVLLIALTAVFAAAKNGLASSTALKNRIVATYLAEEAVDGKKILKIQIC